MQTFPRATARRRVRRSLSLEVLEDRSLPSVAAVTAAGAFAEPAGTIVPAITSSTPSGYTPSQVRVGYGFNQIASLGGNFNNAGAKQTIAIVDAYSNPNIASDLQVFDQTFGVPAPPSLTVLNQSGSTGNLPAANASWAGEIALDVEWAHAMAPAAAIVLVEANSASLGDLLTAVNTAKNYPGVSVVSMSWGGTEFASEVQNDSVFTSPAGKGVTFVASSGDTGAYYGAQWPASSPRVLSVGGTSLSLGAGGAYQWETGWGQSTGGLSNYEKQPAYQQGVVTQSTTRRAVPDVAYDANPNSGVAVYDSVPYHGQSGWFLAGGTSAGAPQWAALVAIADQARVAAGATTLDGASQTLPAIYQLARTAEATSFHDVTGGGNGYAAGPGYDLVTGVGSPRANVVVPALASTGPAGTVSTKSTTATGHNLGRSGGGQTAPRATRPALTLTPSAGDGSTGNVAVALAAAPVLRVSAGVNSGSGTAGVAQSLANVGTTGVAGGVAAPSAAAAAAPGGSAEPEIEPAAPDANDPRPTLPGKAVPGAPNGAPNGAGAGDKQAGVPGEGTSDVRNAGGDEAAVGEQAWVVLDSAGESGGADGALSDTGVWAWAGPLEEGPGAMMVWLLLGAGGFFGRSDDEARRGLRGGSATWS